MDVGIRPDRAEKQIGRTHVDKWTFVTLRSGTVGKVDPNTCDNGEQGPALRILNTVNFTFWQG